MVEPYACTLKFKRADAQRSHCQQQGTQCWLPRCRELCVCVRNARLEPSEATVNNKTRGPSKF